MDSTYTKIFLTTFLITLWVLFAWSPRAYAAEIDLKQCQYKTFKVTAYYSPLPGQDYYNKADFQQEVILNGQWTHGASWRAVFNGMIAAPSSYAFWTKMYFPWRWIGQVHDRGQAIVDQWERNQPYDRIDIWGGKGEEWLRRALSFGVQYLDGYVCPSRAIPQIVGFDFERFPHYEDFFERMLRVMNLSVGRDDPFVQAMQRYLAKLGYFDPDQTTGNFWRLTKAAVCKFQQDYIGLPGSHPSCGVFGPQTRTALYTQIKQKGITLVPMGEMQRQYAAKQAQRALLAQATVTKVDQPEQLTPLREFHNHLFTQGEFKDYEFTRPFTKGEQSKEVRIAQRKLARLWYYDKQDITGVYDSDTIVALYRFQQAQGLLNGTEDPTVRGYFGPGTRRVMNRL